jgi:hypothetical protein
MHPAGFALVAAGCRVALVQTAHNACWERLQGWWYVLCGALSLDNEGCPQHAGRKVCM